MAIEGVTHTTGRRKRVVHRETFFFFLFRLERRNKERTTNTRGHRVSFWGREEKRKEKKKEGEWSFVNVKSGWRGAAAASGVI
jgi:hypothetical protein